MKLKAAEMPLQKRKLKTPQEFRLMKACLLYTSKSTWAQFLLAMFYGVDTTERAKAGSIPTKTKYKPWSGAPMALSLIHI